MSDFVDPKFKLFGKAIPLNSSGDEASADSIDGAADLEADKGIEDSKSTDETNSRPRISDDQIAPVIVLDDSSDADTQKDEKAKGEESKNSGEKTMKKPDKILPCPRCNSKDTKFCYYNNYNVHQPRHFCKGCQRYWTAGGTMRNVPVGAGRRKNKSASSKYCHISISDAHQQQAGLKMNGTVLTFGADSQKEPGDDRSSGSSSITTCGGSVVEEGGLNNQVPFFPGFPMAYGFHPSIPIPFYPVPVWSGAPIPWNVPWVSPILGKRSRDEDARNAPTEAEKRSSQSRVLLPKTLRIDNPEEAAKSSIWTTLGIKKVETSNGGGLGFFNGLQSKGEEKKGKMENNSRFLDANPAAVARSVSFQETA